MPTEAIIQVIESAYIDGIHEKQDTALARSGFHERFRMYVRTDEGLEEVGLDAWLVRIAELKRADPDLWRSPTRAENYRVDICGPAATVRLDVYKGDTHFSRDFMLLYRLPEGWRIVAKAFTVETPSEEA